MAAQTSPLAGLGAAQRELWHYLRDMARGGVIPLVETMCAEYGVSDKTIANWLDDLERVGLVQRVGRGRGRTIVVAENAEKTFGIRRDPQTGKPYRCKRCRCLNPRWNTICAKCNQETRYDRRWKRRAVQVAKEFHRAGKEVKPITIQGVLRRKYDLDVALWDKPQGANDQPAAGLVTTLLEAGLLGDEWRARQRAALGCESWMEEML